MGAHHRAFPRGARAAPDREAWLRAACDDEDTRVEVMAMLQAYDDDPTFMEQSPDLSKAIVQAVSDSFNCRRLGAYRLVAEIGRGGCAATCIDSPPTTSSRIRIGSLPSRG